MNTIGKILGTSIAGAAIAMAGCGKQDFPLNSVSLREVKGLHLFDEDKDGKLSYQEAKNYIMVMLDQDDNKKISRDELGLINRTIEDIKRVSPWYFIDGKFSPNIEATLASFEKLRDEYQSKIQTEEEALIKEKIKALDAK